jgi:hypothetical protein
VAHRVQLSGFVRSLVAFLVMAGIAQGAPRPTTRPRDPPVMRRLMWAERHWQVRVPRGGLRWGTVELPLFTPQGPSAADVDQSNISNCSWKSVVASLAQQHPELVRGMFKEGKDGRLWVRFFKPGRWDGPMEPVWVPITRELPLSKGKLFYTRAPTGALWVALLEKAYAEFFTRHMPTPLRGRRGGYNNIASGGSTVATSIRALTGQQPDLLYVPTTDPAALFAEVQRALAARKVVVASAYMERSGLSYDWQLDLVSSRTGQRTRHVTTVLGAFERRGRKYLRIREQAVQEPESGRRFTLPLEDFARLVQSVSIADPAAPWAPAVAPERSGVKPERLGARARAEEVAFLAWADSAARGIRLDPGALREEYAFVRRGAGPGRAIAAVLDRLPRTPLAEGDYTTRRPLPSLAGMLRSGLIRVDDLPPILAVLRDKQALTLFQLVRDLLLPENASPRLRRILRRADLFNATILDRTIAHADRGIGEWVVLVAEKIHEVDGVWPAIDLRLLEAIGLRRPLSGRPMGGWLGDREWRQMIRELRALGYPLADEPRGAP